MIPNENIYTVTDINRYIKDLLTNDANLRSIYVKGEISNFKKAYNGHFYFSLKDKDCLISAMMFSYYSSKITFEPKDGDEVLLIASIDSYPPRGTYQLIVFSMEPLGLGNQLLNFERLKKKLQAEGLFDPLRKREINIYPKAIGVITAKNSAAIKDILFNLKRRYPIADVYVFYSSVQGENAPKELLKAFMASQTFDLDTLIIGRGGGASEDLSAFNDEALVRAIAKSKMPVISAVGHEIDSTLVDYVADKRASTPTAAAELATVDRREVETHLILALEDMKENLLNKSTRLKEALSKQKLILSSCLSNNLKTTRANIIKMSSDLNYSMKNYFSYYKNLISSRKETLKALDPCNVLKRGYSILTTESGQIVDSTKNIHENDIINITLGDGNITSVVKKVENK